MGEVVVFICLLAYHSPLLAMFSVALCGLGGFRQAPPVLTCMARVFPSVLEVDSVARELKLA